jgi:alpha-glucosidase
MSTLAARDRPWWERGVIYQVYPRSFQDSNADGIGDLPGIVARLDYLAWLGVDAIWLSPIFRSPMADFGYDISDYRDVDPIFGTLEDLDGLVAEAHRRNIQVLLDFVPNHTSDQHPWFLDSRSSRSAERRAWYLWADALPDGSPPTNWLSVFGGSAWEWDAETGQYYYHAFLKEQPDLNWRNPAVREAMFDVLRYWLRRGIDGFRVDVLWHLIKDDRLRDNPPNPDWDASSRRTYDAFLPVYTTDRPEVLDIAAGMRAVLDEFGERVLIAEIYLPVQRLMAYYGSLPERLGAHLPFNFQLLDLPWRADVIAEAVLGYEAALPPHGWPNWVLGNHDRPRIASRVGDAQARVAAMLLLTLRGTPTLYYGDELGLADQPIPPELQQDPARFDGPGRGRDPQRTPMRWDASPNGGFTTGTPWLPIGAFVESINVATQVADPASMLQLVRRLIELRRAEPALSIGDWAPLDGDCDVLAYERRAGDRRIVVLLNLASGPSTVALPVSFSGRIILSTQPDRADEAVGTVAHLGPDEGVIIAAEP